MRQRILHGAVYWGWRASSALAQRLPTRAGYALARAGADLGFLAWREKRETAKHNLATVLGRPAGDPEVTAVARRAFRNFAKYLFDVLRFPAYSHADLARLVAISPETRQALGEARAHSRGIIFVSIHFGNFELGGARIAAEIPLSVVADKIGGARLMDLLASNRAHKNVTLIEPDGAAKKVLRALRRNEMVGLMMDLGPRTLALSNVEAQFFGRTTLFPAVAAELARVSGAPIVTAVVRREADDTFTAMAQPPILVRRTANAAADVQRAVQDVARGLEAFIGERPDQWYIFRPMWPRLERA